MLSPFRLLDPQVALGDRRVALGSEESYAAETAQERPAEWRRKAAAIIATLHAERPRGSVFDRSTVSPIDRAVKAPRLTPRRLPYRDVAKGVDPRFNGSALPGAKGRLVELA